ncbi:small ubiquitin-related modifier 2 [Quercus suber]|uniref:Small ubiquitin-related modifier 2 n=1 Tax=Quercus suber TaxID=58331 RepID=A0AAW0IJM5_QUESU
MENDVLSISRSYRDGNEVFFGIKRSTHLRKLMTACCERQSVEFNSIAFLFDGRRLWGEQTPDEIVNVEGSIYKSSENHDPSIHENSCVYLILLNWTIN